MDEVIDTLQRAVTILENVDDPVHGGLFRALVVLGVRYRYLHRFTEAEQTLLRALTIVESHPSPGWSNEADVLNELGEVNLALCRYDKADSFLRRALQITYEVPVAQQGSTPGVILNDIGKLLVARGDTAEAEEVFRKAYDQRVAVNGPLSANLAEPLGNLGGLYFEMGRYDEAENFLRRALEARLNDPWHGPEHPYLFYSLEGLGRLYIRLERYNEADSLLNWALRNVERAYGPRHLHAAWCLLALGDLATVKNEPDRARMLHNQAYSTAESILGPESPCLESYFRPTFGPAIFASISDRVSHFYE
jgi:tetratricopeptide (TPR) repeat protein